MLFIILSILLLTFSILIMLIVLGFFSTINFSGVAYSLFTFTDWTMLNLNW